jgi:hypothetical protein
MGKIQQSEVTFSMEPGGDSLPFEGDELVVDSHGNICRLLDDMLT